MRWTVLSGQVNRLGHGPAAPMGDFAGLFRTGQCNDLGEPGRGRGGLLLPSRNNKRWMVPNAAEVRLKRGNRAVLEARIRAPTTEQREVLRSRIVLLAAAGRSTRSIAREVATMPRTVSLWRGRYAREGLAGLSDKPRPGPRPKYSAETVRRILAVLDRPPPAGLARWTGELIAAELGDVHEQQVWRVLREHKIDLDGRKSWCESDDPAFAAKAADVVGLYIAPPENSVVICVDEKPTIQALERAQGYLKLLTGRTLTGHSHEYKRNGTSTLFAAFGPKQRYINAVSKDGVSVNCDCRY